MILFTDGGARGNPGPAGAGVVLRNDEKIVEQVCAYLGEKTNNEAEYSALILGLKVAAKHTDAHLEVYMDSELVVKQLNGEYKIKQEHLQKLYFDVKKLEKKFSKVTYSHVTRDKNKEADRLVNEVLDLV